MLIHTRFFHALPCVFLGVCLNFLTFPKWFGRSYSQEYSSEWRGMFGVNFITRQQNFLIQNPQSIHMYVHHNSRKLWCFPLEFCTVGVFSIPNVKVTMFFWTFPVARQVKFISVTDKCVTALSNYSSWCFKNKWLEKLVPANASGKYWG